MDNIKRRPRMGHYFNTIRRNIFDFAAYPIIIRLIIRRPPYQVNFGGRSSSKPTAEMWPMSGRTFMFLSIFDCSLKIFS